jgi:hypothetical protein
VSRGINLFLHESKKRSLERRKKTIFRLLPSAESFVHAIEAETKLSESAKIKVTTSQRWTTKERLNVKLNKEKKKKKKKKREVISTAETRAKKESIAERNNNDRV